MLHRLAIVIALWFMTGPAQGAPVAGTKPKKAAATDERKKGPAMDLHTVRRGETLWGIARIHGVSMGEVMDLNHLSDATLRDGQVLKIPSPGSDPALAPTSPTKHVVARGETFRSIARKYGLTQQDLERANPKTNPAAPPAGSKLTIPAMVSLSETPEPASGKEGAGSTTPAPEKSLPVADAPKKTASPAPTEDGAGNSSLPAKEKPKPKTRRYVVSDDETAQTISEAFNITVSKLYEINGIKPGSSLKTGMEIQVPASPGDER